MRVLRAVWLMVLYPVKRVWLAILLALAYAEDGGDEPDPF
jgi:hypothetical protein